MKRGSIFCLLLCAGIQVAATEQVKNAATIGPPNSYRDPVRTPLCRKRLRFRIHYLPSHTILFTEVSFLSL